MDKKNAVLIVENEKIIYDGLHKFRPSMVSVQVNFSEVRETLAKVSPQAVIFNMDHQAEAIKNILASQYTLHPDTYWVLSSPEISKEDLVEFMRMGISDYLPLPFSEDEFSRFVQRLEDWQSKRKPAEPASEHRMLSFYSPKGGVGLSFIASQLAVSLAKKNLERVLLIDCVLQHGNIAELLDLKPVYTIQDMIENLDRIDVKLLDQSLQKHKSGIYVLPCPKHPEESESFSAKDTVNMLKLFKESFHYTLIDIGHELNATSISCLDLSDLIYMVTTPDLPSLCNVKTSLETFGKLGYKKEKIKLVLNRSGMKGEIDAKTIEKHLNHPIEIRIADDSVNALSAINQGLPVHQVTKHSELLKSLDKLTQSIIQLRAGR